MKTSVNMIQKIAGSSDSMAWSRLVTIYHPYISGWLLQAGIVEHDVEDVCQDVFSAVAKGIKNFHHSGREGAFRNWLRNITVNQCRRYRKKNAKHFDVLSGSKADRFLNRLADPKTELSKRWDREHDKHVLQAILEKLSNEFDYSTMHVFHELVIRKRPAFKVAQELNITVREALAMSSAVMQRVVREAATLEDSDF